MPHDGVIVVLVADGTALKFRNHDVPGFAAKVDALSAEGIFLDRGVLALANASERVMFSVTEYDGQPLSPCQSRESGPSSAVTEASG